MDGDINSSTVMVHFKSKYFSDELCRPVSYTGGKSELTDQIMAEFSDIGSFSKQDIFLQIQDNAWGGMYVDLRQQNIPPMSHIKVVLREHAPVAGPQDTLGTQVQGCTGQRGHTDGTQLQGYTGETGYTDGTQLLGCTGEIGHTDGTQLLGCTGQTDSVEQDASVPLNTDGTQLLGCTGQTSLQILVEQQSKHPESDKNVSDDNIQKMATIFKKSSNRPLTNYQTSVNAAAVELCLKNPGLLHNRQLLLDTAREKIINDGFKFAKGKSRSKKQQHVQQPSPKPKRLKLNQEKRDTRLKHLEEIIKDYDEQIIFKEKRISACINASNFKTCDELKDEIIDLKQKKQEMEAEKKLLLLANRRSKWYYKKKSLSSNADSDTWRASSTPFSSSSEATSPTCVDDSVLHDDSYTHSVQYLNTDLNDSHETVYFQIKAST